MAGFRVDQAAHMPNLLGTISAGWQFGQAERQAREQQEKDAAFARLGPGILKNDPRAFNEAAAVDPQRAMQYQGAADAQLRRLQGAIRYVDEARAKNNPAAVNAALRTVGPFLSQLSGQPAPTEWTPELDAEFEALKAQVSMAGVGGISGVQSTYVDAAGNRVAIMRDGSTQVLGQNDAGMANQTITVIGPDGRPQQMTFNKRTGNYEPASFGGGGDYAPQGQPRPQVPQALVVAGPDGQADDEFANLPAAVRMRVAELEAAGQPFHIANGRLVEGFSPGVLSAPGAGGGGGAPSGPNPFIGQSPAEKAASEAEARLRVESQYAPSIAADTERARIDAQLDAKPREMELDAQAAAMLKAAEAAAEQAAKRDVRSWQALDTLSLLTEAEQLLPNATGSLGGAARDRLYAVWGESTAGAQSTASLKAIAGQLTAKMPRMEGPQSNYDVQLYTQMAGDLANDTLPVPTRLAALRTIRLLNEKYAPGPSTPGGGSQGGKYTVGQIISLPDGRRVRVTSIADPNDPDVEEVQ